jgi:hypothetical protein
MTDVVMELITREIPSGHPLRTLALGFRPRAPVRQRAKDRVHENDRHDNRGGDLQSDTGAKGVGENVEDRTPEQDREVERGEVVVQEELTGFEEEGEVVEGPAQEEEAAHGVVFHNFGWVKG